MLIVGMASLFQVYKQYVDQQQQVDDKESLNETQTNRHWS